MVKDKRWDWIEEKLNFAEKNPTDAAKLADAVTPLPTFRRTGSAAQ
jgi:hypothetical protein